MLFTCATSRAVHLEIITYLSAETFRRFAARRFCPKLIISDNVTNFKLGSDLLKQIFEDTRVQEELYIKGCEWKFILPRAPWFGGFYERVIGTVQGCLKKILFRKAINMDDIHTILVEIEYIINNRPLS